MASQLAIMSEAAIARHLQAEREEMSFERAGGINSVHEELHSCRRAPAVFAHHWNSLIMSLTDC